MEDGEIMWVQEDQGWGVIARQDGDVWFHEARIEGRAFDRLKEGDRVGFELRSPFPVQGKFFSADAVWLETRKSSDSN